MLAKNDQVKQENNEARHVTGCIDLQEKRKRLDPEDSEDISKM